MKHRIFWGLAIAAVLATIAVVGVMRLKAEAATNAPARPAGISFTGYSQDAQRALQRAGGPLGYKASCKVIDANYATASFKVLCTMAEAG